MSDAGSISSVLTTQTQSEQRSAPKVEIVEIPEKLERIEKRETVRGEVKRTEQDGRIRVKTERGEVVIKPERRLNVKDGDAIEIRLDKGQPPVVLSFKVIPKTAQPPAPVTQNQVQNLTLPPALNISTITNAPPLPLTPVTPQTQFAQEIPQIIETLLQPQSTQSSIQPLQAQVPLAAPITLSPILQTTEPPAPSFIPPPPTREILTADIITPFIPPRTDVPLATIAATLIKAPLQAPITLPLTEISEPLQAITQITSAGVADFSAEQKILNEEPQPLLHSPRAESTTAEIIGFTKTQEFPILRITAPESRIGERYVLQTPVTEDIRSGASLTLNITETLPAPTITVTQTQAAPVLYPPLTPPYFLTPEPWAIMQDITQTLIQTNPTIAAQVQVITPNASAPSQLAPTTLFFLAAIKSGDIQNWLGEKAVETLRRAGKGDLLTRLSREAGSIARLNSDTANQEWRVLTLPLAWQNEIHKVVTYYKKEEDSEDAAEKTGSKTRFVMDLSLSAIGKIQLDGLYQEQEKHKRLDLILRSEQHFSQAMKQEMRGLYKNALEETAITGELSFQGSEEQWVNITPDIPASFAEDI